MTALVPMKDKVSTFRAMLEKQAPEIAKALSGAITPDKMVRMLMTDVKANPKLLDCSKDSIMRCIMEAAQLNLVTGGAMGQAYLVPYSKTCTLVIGYKGLLAMAYRSGVVTAIQARVVREGDLFDYRFGIPTHIDHVPARYLSLPLPPLTDVFATADMRSGGKLVEVMQRIEVDAIRMLSKGGNTGPWQTSYDAMALKTVLRRLLKTIPQSSELQYALSETDRLEAVPPPPPGGWDKTEDANGVSGQTIDAESEPEPEPPGPEGQNAGSDG